MLTYIMRTVMLTIDLIAIAVVLVYLVAWVENKILKFRLKRNENTWPGYHPKAEFFDEINDFRSDFDGKEA